MLNPMLPMKLEDMSSEMFVSLLAVSLENTPRPLKTKTEFDFSKIFKTLTGDERPDAEAIFFAEAAVRELFGSCRFVAALYLEAVRRYRNQCQVCIDAQEDKSTGLDAAATLQASTICRPR